MARRRRLVVPGVPHHVTQRGTRKQQTFFGDADRELYLRHLRDYCLRDRVAIWAYCLMPNHVHLVLVPRDEGGLATAVGDAHSAYAREMNATMGWSGHFWQARFYSAPLDERHLHATLRYVVQNPVRAGLVRDVADWPDSSVRALLGGDDPWLTSHEARALRTDWPTFLREYPSDDELVRIRRRLRAAPAPATARGA